MNFNIFQQQQHFLYFRKAKYVIKAKKVRYTLQNLEQKLNKTHIFGSPIEITYHSIGNELEWINNKYEKYTSMCNMRFNLFCLIASIIDNYFYTKTHTMVRHIHNFSSDTVQITPRVPLHKSENSKNQLRQLQSLVLIIQKQILTKCTSIIGTSELLRFTTRSHGIRNFSLPTWNELHTITTKNKNKNKNNRWPNSYKIFKIHSEKITHILYGSAPV